MQKFNTARDAKKDLYGRGCKIVRGEENIISMFDKHTNRLLCQVSVDDGEQVVMYGDLPDKVDKLTENQRVHMGAQNDPASGGISGPY